MQRYRMETCVYKKDTGMPHVNSTCGADVTVFPRPDENGAWVQAGVAEARVNELERDIGFLSQAGECFEVTLLAARAAGDSTKNLPEWLSGRLELLAKLEPGEGRACVREEVVDVAHRHGWLGGISLLDWLDRKLRERNDYQIRLNKLRDALGQES